MTGRTTRAMLVVLLATLFAAGCGGDEGFKDPDPPVGAALLPDIVPTPPKHVQLLRKGKVWELAFTSILVNIGEGDFILRAKRDGSGDWHADQVVEHATSGAEGIPTPADLVWGGDGHDHWHIERVATNRLVPLDAEGEPMNRTVGVDTKVGFCYYDFKKVLDKGPRRARYVHETCGKANDVYIGMGLSPGWEDVYPFLLPGQTIDITDLPDGKYRMWVNADEPRWFREVTHDNNVTWIDIDLSTVGPNRFAGVIRTGPTPVPGSKP